MIVDDKVREFLCAHPECSTVRYQTAGHPCCSEHQEWFAMHVTIIQLRAEVERSREAMRCARAAIDGNALGDGSFVAHGILGEALAREDGGE